MTEERRHARAQLLAFLAQHGQPLDFRGEQMDELCLTGPAAREFLDLIRQVGLAPIGMEIWRWDGEGLDIDGPKTWYPEAECTLPEIHADAMLYLERIRPGPDDRLTVQFE